MAKVALWITFSLAILICLLAPDSGAGRKIDEAYSYF